MSASLRFQRNFGPFNNRPFTDEQTINGGSAVIVDKASIAAAKAGTLTTRTDNDTGVVTLSAGHGQTSGVFDIFWSGGCRTGMTGTVATNALTLDGGSGDNLPVATTPINVTKGTTVEMRFDGDDLKGIAVYCDGQGAITLINTGDVDQYTFHRPQAGSDGWHNKDGKANPVVGDVIGTVRLSNGATAVKDMRAVAIVGDE